MIKRAILDDLRKHLIEPELTVLIGPRQIGKTFLMQVLKKELDQQGKKTVYLNLDIEDHRQYFLSQRALLDHLYLQVGKLPAYIFIDEIQRKENAGLFLKGIYDMRLPYKFIVSGSGSLDLKAKIKESMAGRKRIFMIEPISFFEFANYKTAYKYENKLIDFFTIEKMETQNLFSSYLMFGAYPKVIIAETADKKKSEMDEIYRSYIERDITDLLGVEKPEAFANLLKILASQIGSLVNLTELSSTIGISVKTIQNYLWYLEETYIIKKVTPYFRNIRSEISKTPIYYFYDLGLRNYLLGLFGLPQLPPSLSGHLFENFIFNSLRKGMQTGSANLHFWRTTDNAEVDFVVASGLTAAPVEVKYSKLEKAKISRSLKSFLTKYKPAKAYIIHLGERFDSQFEKTKISFIPYFESVTIIKEMKLR